MALPCSPPLSLRDIAEELFGEEIGTVTLKYCAQAAGLPLPVSILDFLCYEAPQISNCVATNNHPNGFNVTFDITNPPPNLTTDYRFLVSVYENDVYVGENIAVPTSPFTITSFSGGGSFVEGRDYKFGLELFYGVTFGSSPVITSCVTNSATYTAATTTTTTTTLVAPGTPKSFNTVQYRAPAGTNGVEIGYTAPTSGGPVENYRVEYRHREDGEVFFSNWELAINAGPITGPTLPHSFFTVYPSNTEMEFRVRAENSAGVSDYRQWSGGQFIYY